MKNIVILLALLPVFGCVTYTANDTDLAKANSGEIIQSEARGTGSMGWKAGTQLVKRMAWDQIEAGGRPISGWVLLDDGPTIVAHRPIGEPILDKNGVVVAWRCKGDRNEHPDDYLIWVSNYRGTIINMP